MHLLSALLASLAVCSLVDASPVKLPPPPSLPSYLGSANTFYRAITGGEVAEATTIYKVGQHPTKHTTIEGDFSFSGGLYVFKDIYQAKDWGFCRAKLQPTPERKKWYLITMQYTPKSGLAIKGFKDPTAEWKTFVNDNYKKQGPHYDIIEGPISVKSGSALTPYLHESAMVWEAAFVGQTALSTLVVQAITQYDDKGQAGDCCQRQCNIQFKFVDQSTVNDWGAFELDD